MKWNWRPLSLKSCHFEASKDIIVKFKSQALHIKKIKYWKASGSGNLPSLNSTLWNIGILLHKQATHTKHSWGECMYIRFLNFIYNFFITGMIAWNVIAALSSFASLLTWIVQYFVKLRENVLIREDKTEGRWTTSGKANIGHSFWLVVVAFAIFCLNVTILHFLRKRRNKSQNSKRAIVEATTKPNGNLMLYWAINFEWITYLFRCALMAALPSMQISDSDSRPLIHDTC